jgi:hypothetical protein
VLLSIFIGIFCWLLTMRFTALAFAAAAARGVFAAPRPDDSRSTFGCAAPEPDAEHRRISQMFAAQEAEVAASGNFTMMATVTIDTYFHVVASSTSLSGGYVTVCPPLRNRPRWMRMVR